MLTTIVGKNDYRCAQKLTQLKHEFARQYGDTNLSEVNAESATFDDLWSLISSVGLFSENNMVVLRSVSKNKFMQEKLGEKIDSIPNSSHLIVYEPQFDRRSALFKKLKKLDDFFDFESLHENELVKWVVESAKKQKSEIGFSEATLLVNRLNFDQWTISSELQKLVNLERTITKQLIEGVVDESFNETIFSLLDLAFSKHSDEAMNKYRLMLSNRIEPHYIMSMIIWQVQILLVIAYSENRSNEQIVAENKFSPYVVSKSRGLLQNTSIRELKRVVSLASEIDIKSKTKAAYDMSAAVDLLLARIAS